MRRNALILMVLMMCAVMLTASAGEPKAMNSLDELLLLSGEGFLSEGSDAMYFKDHAGGHWLYVSDSVRVEITRYQSATPLLTWYIADLQCAPGYSLFTLDSETTTGKQNNLPQKMAQNGRVVYAQNADFYTYRVSHKRTAGIIIRNGKALYSKSYSKAVTAIPNLATMGFYSSGKAEVNEAWEMSAQDYINKGASTVVAFGPILVRDGEIQEITAENHIHSEPRSCIGIVSTRHYVGLVAEGRNNHSDGATLARCAQILYDYGCWDAINLDGGGTTAMLFMGESVMLNDAGGVDVNDRAIPDILCVGEY